VQRMSMVSPELGVGSLQRRVSRGLGLLDTVSPLISHLVRDSSSYVWENLLGEGSDVPVPMRLRRLIVLRRVLRLCGFVSFSLCGTSQNSDVLAIAAIYCAMLVRGDRVVMTLWLLGGVV
jgi:hypothetical protein